MAQYVEATVRSLDDRLGELQAEIGKLEAARSALTGPTRRGPGRPRAGEARRGPGRPRATQAASAPARRGPGRPRSGETRAAGRSNGRRNGQTRAGQTFALIAAHPGITIPELAQRMNIKPDYLYQIVPKLVADGQVTKDGKALTAAA